MTAPTIIGDATLYCGDVCECLRLFDADSVDCVVTSPPYWGLRDYGVEGMIGLEPTFAEYLARMVAVFDEVKRVLKPTGTCWVNMGDCYAGGGRGTYCDDGSKQSTNIGSTADASKRDCFRKPDGFKPKDLLLMPARLAIALQDAGWWVRQDNIWFKPNPMPESVTDRTTSSFEHVFHLTKRATYFYDADAVREPQLTPMDTKANQTFGAKGGKAEQVYGSKVSGDKWEPNGGRNLRNVWTIATQPYPEAHFATFPEELPRKCIMAGSSERGVCSQCGKPWERVVEKKLTGVDETRPDNNMPGRKGNGLTRRRAGDPNSTTLGWQPTCTCDALTVPATVLDIFSGSGTTLKVALELGRKAIGIELNPEYMQLIMKRIAIVANQTRLPL